MSANEKNMFGILTRLVLKSVQKLASPIHKKSPHHSNHKNHTNHSPKHVPPLPCLCCQVFHDIGDVAQAAFIERVVNKLTISFGLHHTGPAKDRQVLAGYALFQA